MDFSGLYISRVILCQKLTETVNELFGCYEIRSKNYGRSVICSGDLTQIKLNIHGCSKERYEIIDSISDKFIEYPLQKYKLRINKIPHPYTPIFGLSRKDENEFHSMLDEIGIPYAYEIISKPLNIAATIKMIYNNETHTDIMERLWYVPLYYIFVNLGCDLTLIIINIFFHLAASSSKVKNLPIIPFIDKEHNIGCAIKVFNDTRRRMGLSEMRFNFNW